MEPGAPFTSLTKALRPELVEIILSCLSDDEKGGFALVQYEFDHGAPIAPNVWGRALLAKNIQSRCIERGEWMALAVTMHPGEIIHLGERIIEHIDLRTVMRMTLFPSSICSALEARKNRSFSSGIVVADPTPTGAKNCSSTRPFPSSGLP